MHLGLSKLASFLFRVELLGCWAGDIGDANNMCAGIEFKPARETHVGRNDASHVSTPAPMA